MALLIIQGVGTGGDLRQPLRSGVNRLGRRDDNHIQIVHPTVSGEHCELAVEGGALSIRDVGSTNGTFIGTERIQQGTVQHGQSFRAGDIAIMYFADNPMAAGASAADIHVAIPQAAPDESQTVARGEFDCTEHAGVEGDYFCGKCLSQWCGDCIKILSVAGRSHRLCPKCSHKCIPMGEHMKALGLLNVSFFKVLPSAFSYPLHKNGPWYVLGGALLAGAMDLAGRLSFGMSGMFLGVFYTAYMLTFFRNIILSTANGEKEVPGWPDVTSVYEDLVTPLFECLAIWALFIGPGVLVGRFVDPNIGLGCLALGVLLLPMALLLVAMTDSLASLNPVLLFASIAKVPLDYLVTGITFLLVAGGTGGIGWLLERTKIPVFPAMISTLVGLYGMMVAMRILGLLYYANRKKLGWFERTR